VTIIAIIIIQIVTLQGYVAAIVMVCYVLIPGGINDNCFIARTSEITKRLLEIGNWKLVSI
jgi:hypothetical protein